MEIIKPDSEQNADLNDLELDGVEFVNIADSLAFPEGGASCGYSCCCSGSCC